MQTSLFASEKPQIACLDIPAFPLQLVLRQHPEWREDPVVLVEEDRPTAGILWANRPARNLRIRRGMKFAHARSLVARLHGEVVSKDTISTAVEELLQTLLQLTPNVEPDPGAPGLFWLDPRGLAPLFGSLESWAQQVHEHVQEQELVNSVVVGWQRGTIFAIARARMGFTVLPDRETESRQAGGVPLTRLALSPTLLRSMAVLDIKTLEEFVALPSAGLRLRYGEEAARLHAITSGDAWFPFRAHRPERIFQAEIPLDPPDSDHTRLLFGMKGVLHSLLDDLARDDRGVIALHITLDLDHAPSHRERIETASPTLDATRLIDLVRLRLNHMQLVASVERIVLVLENRPLSTTQSDCIRKEPRRNLRDLSNALARLKASFGPESVVRARIVDTHCPEKRFRWEPAAEIPEPRAQPEGADDEDPAPLIRCVYPTPIPLPDPPLRERERWLGGHGAVETMQGPDRLRTGWWEEHQNRDYYWVVTRTGEVLWIFQDKTSQRWFLHGAVD